jgi:hypothetical protein
VVAHALIHVADLTLQRTTNPLTDIAAVIVPSALALWAALPEKGEGHCLDGMPG